MTLSEVRDVAMALLGTTESPHFNYTSFRVRGRIFATAPKEGGRLHVFVDDAERDRWVAMRPETFERLGWGRKMAGLKVDLAGADPEDVKSLLRTAWQRKLGQHA
jgi:hypothetical protein